MRGFEHIVERQIQEALEDGRLSGLPGEGQPLRPRSDAFTDPIEAAGFQMMAKSGAIPEVLRLRKALAEAHASYAACGDPDEKARLMRAISDLDLRHNLAREKRRGK